MFQTKNRRLYGVIVIVVLAVGAICFSLFRGADKSQSQASSQSQQSQSHQTQQTQSQSSQNKGYIDSVAADDPYAKGIHHVRIVVKDYGTIEATLNANVAPITVSNFAHLAESGFYNGLTFHRIIDGFMIQGGDPKGNGSGGCENICKGVKPTDSNGTIPASEQPVIESITMID